MALGVQFHEEEDLRPKMGGNKISKQNMAFMVLVIVILIGGALFVYSESYLNEPTLGPDVLTPGERPPASRSL